ncbi:MAG: RIP metalloprotease RseP [Brevinematia bacterium]
MLSTLFGFVIAIFVMGILILVHELGHFLFAKMNGIGVEAFSIGFGNELFGFTIGETRYRISTIPFGGYCKLKGEGDKEDSAPDSMYNRPAYARLLTVLAGPLFNYLFAFIILIILFNAGYKDKLIAPYIDVIEKVGDNPTPAFNAGLKSGDYILSIDDKPVESYADIPKYIALSKTENLKITFLREGKTNEITVKTIYDKNRGVSYLGVSMLFLPVVGNVMPNSPAEKVQLKENDRIVSINGKKINYFFELREMIKDKANSEIEIVYERASKLYTNRVKLDRFEGIGFLGVYPKEVIFFEKSVKARNFVNSIAMSFNEINKIIIETLQGISAMIRGRINPQKNLSGPLRIINITSEIAMNTDFITLIRFIVLLSVALAFFNLLPIPGLDGSHVILNFIETVTPIKIPLKVRTYIEYAGFIFIILLSALVFLNDIINIFGGR